MTFGSIATLLFASVWVAVVLREVIGSRKHHHGEWARLPLDNDGEHR